MYIRPATVEDIPSLLALAKQLFDLHFQFDSEYYQLEPNFDELFTSWLREQLTYYNNQFILVAQNSELQNSEKKITGFISGFIKSLYPWFRTKAVGHISYLVIDPNFQRRKIGQFLENAAISWFKARNVSYIELYVEEKNEVGKIAWTSYGFGPFKKFLRKKI